MIKNESLQEYCTNILHKNIVLNEIYVHKDFTGVLPNGMNANSIYIEGNTKLPDSFLCKKLILSNTNINFISTEQIKSIENLAIHFSKCHVHLPDNTHLESLSLVGSKIEYLPENLFIEKFLDIRDTYIKDIPDGTYIGRWIQHTQVLNISGVIFDYLNGISIIKKL